MAVLIVPDRTIASIIKLNTLEGVDKEALTQGILHGMLFCSGFNLSKPWVREKILFRKEISTIYTQTLVKVKPAEPTEISEPPITPISAMINILPEE